MPLKMALGKRKTKTHDKTSYSRRMRLYRNLPKSYPRPGNLLIKSQYCDFELTHLVPMVAAGGQAGE